MPGFHRRRWLAITACLSVAFAVSAFGIWGAPARSPTPVRVAAGVPVEVAAAERRDVPVHLTGIGTVTPFNTVTIRSRVDGELQQVLFSEGQDIRKGDLIAVIDPRLFQAALDQANAKLQQDEASLANARLNLGRDTKLGKDAFASQQMIDNESSSVDQLVAQIAQDKAMIDNAQTQLSYTKITAPIDGRAGIRLVDQGNIVHAADAGGLVVLNQFHPISVVSTLPQTDVPAIRAALAAGTVEALATSRDDGTTLDVGTVELIDNQIDPQSGTVRLKSIFPNKADALWPGQFVDVQVLVATLKAALTVPSDAVQRGPAGPYVYVVGAADTVDVAPVKVGQIADNTAVITDGLTEGQRVVVRGQYRLAPGTRVTPSAPAASGS
ncbi:efflux RND transporter periplasmic adaptor subunit [Ancylobacter sp.]|uniref:efflux RND transporter periplasmic adaptor subunit n=1 Tax=Ancylobacter sp. TaxID=1872567 RepID=UPI003D0A9388